MLLQTVTSTTQDESEVSAMPKQLYEQHTQYRYWLFSPEELNLMRNKHNERAHQRIMANWQQEWKLLGKEAPEDFTLLKVSDELTLCKYYEQTIQSACRRFNFPESVSATAITFMKRFYLFNTVMDYPLKNIMPTCLYLASKIEGFFLTIDEFVSKFTKVNTQDIIEMEMPVCESLKFHFTIYQPYRPLYGFFLDLQRTGVAMDLLRATYERAIKWVCTSLYTDACLLYQPAQIALTAWCLAAEETGLDIKRYLDELLPTMTGRVDNATFKQLLSTLDIIATCLRDYKPITQKQATTIDVQLNQCRNPARNPKSALYKQQQQQEAEAKKEQHRQKRQKKTAESTDHASVFV